MVYELKIKKVVICFVHMIDSISEKAEEEL